MNLTRILNANGSHTLNYCATRLLPISLQTRKFSDAGYPKMPECDYTPPTYNGKSYKTIRSGYNNFISPTVKLFYEKPLLLHEGKRQWLWDSDGKRYLDMYGGIVTVSVGHSHPKIASAIRDQSSKLNYISPCYMHPRFIEYAEKLTAKFPGDLKVVYLLNSGSEANELAFQMARLHTKNYAILSLKNSYHGGTHATRAATSLTNWNFPITPPSGHIHTVFPDVYNGLWGGSKCRDSPVQVQSRNCDCKDSECLASDKYLREMQDIFRFSMPAGGNIAGFIAESIQGVGGTVQYPKTFLKKAFDLTRKMGGVCIADEVQTGFGRTGEHFWGFEGHDVIPDIVTMAKGIGNGFPLAAVVTTPEIDRSLSRARHFNTFGGNPLGCAVGSAVLDIIEEEGLQHNSHVVGTHLINRLSTLLSDFPEIVGDVRGKGLMLAVELISNSKTKEPLKIEHVNEIFEDSKDMGLLVGKGGVDLNVLRIKPPMCITKEDADFTYEVLYTALRRFQEKHSLNGN